MTQRLHFSTFLFLVDFRGNFPIQFDIAEKVKRIHNKALIITLLKRKCTREKIEKSNSPWNNLEVHLKKHKKVYALQSIIQKYKM